MADRSAIWNEADLSNPHEVADKARRVREMFAAIARSYDLNNRVHSLGRDQAWRRAAVRAADMKGQEVVLDVACGTGDLALAFERALGTGASSKGRVIGLDFTPPMLELAVKKIPRGGGAADRGRSGAGERLAFGAGDAMRLPLADASVDVVSIAFGIRNVVQPETAVREFARVLRPGGRLIVLEFSLPTNRFLRWLYQGYFNHVLPWTASLIAWDWTGAYRYLPRSVSTFISREAMSDMMAQAGFAQISTQPLTLGIAVVYRGVKREGVGADNAE
ncbi:MAG: bifunctional demethylmenaquinone methyltransferase/2-methoxy-6-polyprenyl-1,4-benzoquinol methylase UbiE [Phycisphaeraceae bacterium]|nr:bifunctional demethylmenaquinone methyltransferase/2-methoxy-6-polyprenyl-1,4-benzoquinol methylase UbiE [Phycisphaeraceae bacterium]